MNNLWYTDGRKSVSVSRMDDFLDWLIAEDGAEDGEIRWNLAMRKVAFVYRCVRLIADAVRAAPWRIVPVGSDDVYDDSGDYQNRLGWLPDPRRVIELVARSLLGPGSAYLFKTMQGTILKDLRYMVASTLSPIIDGDEGLVGFEREVNGKRTVYDAERLVYFWPADESVELGPPKSSPVKAGLMAAGADYYTAKFISDFFARGAIKGTLLAVKGNPVEAERERLKDWFKRTFFGGSSTSFNTEIINADTVEPVKIGEGLESLNNSELTKQMREDIAVSMGVPMSKLLSSSVSGLGGGGVAESDDVGFYTDTVKPLGDFIAEVLNAQLLRPMGYQWLWLWDTLDVFQQDENQRAQAFKTYVDAGMVADVAAYMLGIEIPVPDDVPEHYAEAFGLDEEEEEPMPGQAPPEMLEQQRLLQQTAGAEGPGNGRADMAETMRSIDLDKWERMAARRFDEGHPEKALEFETELIPHAMAEGIRKALGGCEDAGDVRALFADVEMVEALGKKGDAPAGGRGLRKAAETPDDPLNDIKRKHEQNVEYQLLQVWRDFGEKLAQLLRENAPQPEQKGIVDTVLGAALWGDLAKALTKVLLPSFERMMQEGAHQALEDLPFAIGVDWDLINTEAADWAREHVTDMIEDMEDVTRERVRSSVTNWIESGEELPKLTQRMQDIFEAPWRAKMVAVTEVTRAFAEANERAWKESRVIKKKQWQTALDDIRCDICMGLQGKIVGVGKQFPGGYDNPPAHPNCVLPGNVVSVPGLIAGTKSFYIGGAIEIRTFGGRVLTVTKNHPILTTQGWVPARLLGEGVDVVVCSTPEWIASSVYPDYQHMPAAIEKIFDTLKMSVGVATARMPAAAEDFHGDGRAIYGNVHIVGPNGLLLGNVEAELAELLGEFSFQCDDSQASLFTGNGPLAFLFPGDSSPAGSFMSSGDLISAALGRHARPLEFLSSGLPTYSNVMFSEDTIDNPTADTKLAAEFVRRFSSLIATDKIISVRQFDFSGHVYDLQSGLYALCTVNEIVASNCRCWIVPVVD